METGGITVDQGKQDLLVVAKSKGATVERLMAVEFTTWAGIPGEPYKR